LVTKPFRRIRLGRSYVLEALLCCLYATAAVPAILYLIFEQPPKWPALPEGYYLVGALVLLWWIGLLGQRPFFSHGRWSRRSLVLHPFIHSALTSALLLGALVVFNLYAAGAGEQPDWADPKTRHHFQRVAVEIALLVPLLLWTLRLDLRKWDMYDEQVLAQPVRSRRLSRTR
jgi:hypothetical protein